MNLMQQCIYPSLSPLLPFLLWMELENRIQPHFGNQMGENEDFINSFPFIGLLYSAFTYYTGFRVNSGEYKLMGLAPYGKPIYKDIIYDKLIDVKEDGSFKLVMKYFNYTTGFTMTNDHFHALFNRPPRTPETEITQLDMDIAASIQLVTEEVVLKIVQHLHQVTDQTNLCLAGGVALNVFQMGNY